LRLQWRRHRLRLHAAWAAIQAEAVLVSAEAALTSRVAALAPWVAVLTSRVEAFAVVVVAGVAAASDLELRLA
jgi:hypothetical protein